MLPLQMALQLLAECMPIWLHQSLHTDKSQCRGNENPRNGGQVLQSYITVPPAGSSHETHPQTIPTARILATPPRLTSRAATPGTNDPALPRAIKCMIARPDPFSRSLIDGVGKFNTQGRAMARVYRIACVIARPDPFLRSPLGLLKVYII